MKAITMYRPRALENALCDFDRYFESFFGDSVLDPSARVFNNVPAVDIRETEKAYLLEMELPGYEEKDIEIHIDGSNLSIASKREESTEVTKDKESGEWLLRERRSRTFSRAFKLPENADPAEVSADFKNGILSMEVKKRAEAQKRLIQINTR